jgi:hypothetical protein
MAPRQVAGPMTAADHVLPVTLRKSWQTGGPSTHDPLPKFTGTSVIIAFVPVYALVAMALAQARPVQEAAGAILVLCYAALGMVWIVPVMPLTGWMEKPDPGP